MPQSAEREAALGQLDRLGQVVVDRPAGDREPLADLAGALMVMGLDRRLLRPDRLGGQRAGLEADLVLAEDPGLDAVAIASEHVGEMGLERAAGGHVEKLHPPADPEQGQVALESAVGESDLEAVARRVGPGHARVWRRAVGERVDVRAAGEKHAVEDVEELVGMLGDRVVRGQEERDPVGALHGVRVRAREHRRRVVPDAVAHVLDGGTEADDRASHVINASERPHQESRLPPHPTGSPAMGQTDAVRLNLVPVSQMLAEAGCIAASEEADELVRAAGGDPDVLSELVTRRTRGEPIAWLTGAVTFCGVELRVEPGIYVPRWQTEPLARRAVTLLPRAGVAVDLCTGVGAIAAVLAAAVPTARILATDEDDSAVRCARRNGVEVFAGFLDDPLPRELEHRVDVLTAVTPYVPTNSLRLLPRDVQAFEPPLALDGGADGTDLLVEVARRSTRWLRPGGWLLLELGGDQAAPIGGLLDELGFEDLEVMADEEGDPRAVCARLG